MKGKTYEEVNSNDTAYTKKRDYTGHSLHVCSDQLFELFVAAENHFRSLKDMDTGQVWKKMSSSFTQTESSAPECCNVIRKLMKRFFQYRLRIHGIQLQRDVENKNKIAGNPSLGDAKSSRSMTMFKIINNL